MKTRRLRYRLPIGLLLVAAVLVILVPRSSGVTPTGHVLAATLPQDQASEQAARSALPGEPGPPGVPGPPGEDRTWECLPLAVRRKVDGRVLAELRGDVLPAHLSGRPGKVAPPKEHRSASTTRFLVYLVAQADLQALQTRSYASLAQRRTSVVDALVSTAQATQSPVRRLLSAQAASGDVVAYFPY